MWHCKKTNNNNNNTGKQKKNLATRRTPMRTSSKIYDHPVLLDGLQGLNDLETLVEPIGVVYGKGSNSLPLTSVCISRFCTHVHSKRVPPTRIPRIPFLFFLLRCCARHDGDSLGMNDDLVHPKCETQEYESSNRTTPPTKPQNTTQNQHTNLNSISRRIAETVKQIVLSE